MKKVIFFFAGLSVLVLTGSYSADAQDLVFVPADGYVIPVSPKTVGRELISFRALRDFDRSYRRAEDAQWSQTKEGGFVCRFIESGILNRAYYDRKGYWLYTLTSYYEDKLSFDLRDKVKRVYYDFSITYVQELKSAKGNTIIYLIQLQNKNKIIILRILDDVMEVMREYDKSQGKF